MEPAALAVELERRGAGEILLTAVERDGTGLGYDLELVAEVTSRVGVPVIAFGGAGSLADLARVVREVRGRGALVRLPRQEPRGPDHLPGRWNDRCGVRLKRVDERAPGA